MTKYIFILSLVFCVVCQSADKPQKDKGSSPQSARTENSSVVVLVDKAEKQLTKGKYKKAIEILEKALSDGRLAGAARGRASVLLARAQRLDGSPEKSVQTLQKLIETKDPLHYVELGEAYLALLDYDEALRSISTYNMKEPSDVLVRALWVRARAEFALVDYLKCIETCRSVLREIENCRRRTDSDIRNLEEFSEIGKQALALLDKAQELFDRRTYGDDYANYRKARRADFDGEYDLAIKNYSKIRSGVFFQAAALFTGKCLKASGEGKESLRKFKEITENDPSSPYAGEAALELAEDIYIKSGAEDALKQIAWFEDWAAREEKTAEELNRPDGINNALWGDIIEKTPKRYLDADEYGNLVRTARMPESVINSRTSPWYLPLLRVRAAVCKGYWIGETGDKARAMEIYKSLPSLGGQVRVVSDKGMIDALLEGLADGFPGPLPAVCAKKLGRERRNALAILCLKGASGEHEIIPSLKALAGGADTEERKYEERAILYCLANYQVAYGDMAEAEKTLRLISKDKHKIAIPLDDEIDTLLADILARDPKNREEAADLYKKVSDRRGGKASSVLLSLAVMLANQGDNEGAADACIELLRCHSETPQAAAAATLANFIIPSDKLKKKASLFGVRIAEQSNGKLIHHVRTIVVPGGADWEISPDELESGDIVQYNIRCISRDNCTLIKSFEVSVNPNEPQPPRSKTNEIVFYRAPVLSLPGLSRNFDELAEKKK